MRIPVKGSPNYLAEEKLSIFDHSLYAEVRFYFFHQLRENLLIIVVFVFSWAMGTLNNQTNEIASIVIEQQNSYWSFPEIEVVESE